MKFLLVVTLITLALVQDIKANVCGSDLCGPDECCRIGMQRYSVPRCEKFGQEGNNCRTDNVGQDRVFYYPGGNTIQAKNVYTMFCPCKAGLQCSKGTCQ